LAIDTHRLIKLRISNALDYTFNRAYRSSLSKSDTVIALNAIGDLINVITGTEPKAIVGIPVTFLVLAYLMRKQTKNYFRQRGH
jgi:hypothetical protein